MRRSAYVTIGDFPPYHIFQIGDMHAIFSNHIWRLLPQPLYRLYSKVKSMSLTKKEIIAELENAKIIFDRDALKKDLLEIYEKHISGEPSDVKYEESVETEYIPEPEPTPFVDSPMLPEKKEEPVSEPITEKEPTCNCSPGDGCNICGGQPVSEPVVKAETKISLAMMRHKLLSHRDVSVRRHARALKEDAHIIDYYNKVF